MGFWNKANRVVLYKTRLVVDAHKKEVLDKQLDLLLGQTQKYSTTLAARLTNAAEEAPAARQEQKPGACGSCRALRTYPSSMRSRLSSRYNCQLRTFVQH